MKIKRVVQGTALAALAAAAWMGAGSTDASAKATATGIAADSTGNYVLNVKGTGKEIMVGVAKVAKTGKASIASWDVYDGTEAAVDLSKLNATVDNYIAIKDNDEKVTFIGIAASAKKTTIGFNAAIGKITEVVTKTGTDNKEAKPTEIEYRTATSNWSSKTALASIDLAKYQHQGAILYVRVSADSAAKVGTATVKFEDVEYTVEDKGSLPSKETKLNIAKRANGPAVTLDYTKGTAKVKAKTEYRVVGSSITSGSSVISDKGATLDVAEEIVGNDTEAVLEVRVKAVVDSSNVKKCKAASKWTRVLIEKPKAFETVAGTISSGSAATATTEQALAEVTTGSATSIIKVNYTTKTVKGVVTKTGYKLTNSSTLAYQYYIGDAEPTATTASKDIKSLKAKKNSDIVANIAKNFGNSKIYIRVAGDKKSKTWVGKWAELVKLPEIK